jgi:hypothetical protein
MKPYKEKRVEFGLIVLAAALIAAGGVLNPRGLCAGNEAPIPGARSPEELVRQGFKPLFDGYRWRRKNERRIFASPSKPSFHFAKLHL